MPHHAFLGNHDYFATRRGERVDGYALLGQEPAPRAVDLAGWRLILLATGFFMMVLASTIVANGDLAMPTWLVLTYMFHTFGELALSPVGLSATTKLAPHRYVGQMMGIWFVSIALGNLIAGQIAGEFDPDNIAAFPEQYWGIVMTTAQSRQNR